MAHFRLSAKGHTIDGEQFVFTLHCSEAVVVASDILPAWQTAVTDLWGTGTGTTAGIAQFYPDSFGIDEVIVDELDPATGLNVRQARAGLSLVGESVAEPLPPQVSVCVSLRTALPTRAGRGRFFLPGPDTTTCVAGRMTGGARTTFLNAAADLIGDVNDSGALAEIYHRTTRTGTAITSFDVGDVFDTQRSRRDKLVEARASLSV